MEGHNIGTMYEVGVLQQEYQRLVDNRKLTKKAMCDLCIPFRDKYGLTDKQTLMIARNEMSILEMVELFNCELEN